MEKISVSDLSIGDWVQYRDREWQVCSLYQFTEEVGLWRKDSQICEYVAYCESIPLTPEILEKNGWSKKYDDVWECGVWRISQINKCLFVLYNEKYDYDFCVYIDTVHQLQHALRLVAVGKEIVL